MSASRADPDRPPWRPPPGRRVWEWLTPEPVSARERRLAALPILDAREQATVDAIQGQQQRQAAHGTR